MTIYDSLFEMRDENYKQFHKKLIPGINPDSIIGVRVPLLRKFAKTIFRTDECLKFLNELPHKFYDENCLHSILISEIKDFETALFYTEKFLPYVDNWAVCDILSPKAFKKNPKRLLDNIIKWTESDKTYTVRFGIKMQMDLFLEENFEPRFPEIISRIKSGDYYVDMMSAWYFATALAKRYDDVIPYLEEKRLPKQVHNKTVQKAIESYRISDDKKDYLRTLKIKQ